MSYEEYTRLFELNKLIKKLDDTKYENCHELTLDFSRLVNETHKETLKNICCNLELGYTYLTARGGKTLTDLCKYLNLWLNKKKRTHVNSGITEGEWQTVENLWITLMQRQTTDHKCERKPEEKSISEYSKRLDLMSYCINRDYFKRLCQSPVGSDDYKAQKCKGFSDYTHDNYKKLIKDVKCIDKKSDNNDYKYYISDDCTLYDIPRTFPKCEAHSPTFVENDNSKTNIMCETTEQVESGGTESSENLAEHTERNGALDNHPDIPDDPAKRPETPRGPVKLPEATGASEDLTELYLPSPTNVNSIDNGTSKSIYYAGLSALGVFFTSMVLYKYTPLGSFIRSLVSKKEKLRQTTNKHLAQQWLQRTSEYMDPNSENAHYNFPYHNIQNEFPHNR
ncbi:variable surface protein Vir17, putative [Plasmodium vivax]|uniref:Variable surface protein Vir17, putative n=1 Tax=Plasmodium vivax (strain Salvador I) TaxID=126793 RepID=A5KD03_PLAVS|nr:variable surface protein Vir17, putative [Plasmodium vivax]EDL42765.1 variable surface protein Vir17, putative [Plasmodium vivax]|eukprot:XP_001612558.1 variable surface protein Vir17 [Plasmodium vivax Sal-1]